MPMLSYHPALDPYHAAFRILRALVLAGGSTEEDRLRLLDLYLLFPHLASEMTLPSKVRGWRTVLDEYQNPYWFSGDTMLVFQQIRPIHEAGLALLETTGFLQRDDAPRRWSLLQLDHPLTDAATDQNVRDAELSQFLRDVVIPLELGGQRGLKARSGLLEWRYNEN